MKIRHYIAATLALLAMTGPVAGQDNFQLPRECSERQNVDPQKCVIQDGPPRAPWVHKVTAGPNKPHSNSAPVLAPPAATAQPSPAVRAAPRR